MPLVFNRPEVLSIYQEAAERRWVLPSFGTENLVTTEAILAAALDHSRRIDSADFPITLALTHRYPARRQSAAYSPTGNAALGMRLFQADIRTLTAADSPYARLRVTLHLDHGQPDRDQDVLDNPAGMFSSVMFDASSLPFEENIAATHSFVQRHGSEVIIEGACDAIVEAAAVANSACTTPEEADRFFQHTGVDWIVANLGTEHRAGTAHLRYRNDLAREISRRIGPRLCLHGASSVNPDHLSALFDDGVRKVNLWTALEREGAAALFTSLVEHAAQTAGPKVATALQGRGLLGAMADVRSAASLDWFTARHRQDVVFATMKQLVSNYLNIWCP
jgi:fructose/tagatose bisphosphate aldolase